MTYFEPPIPFHHWLPAHKYAFGWHPIYGGFPYYHVAKDIYDALNAGLTPSALNPFATIAYVAKQIENNRLRVAWGTVGNMASGERVIDFVAGVSSGGSYHGDTGFTVSPAAILSVASMDATNTDHHGFSTGIINLTNISMTIAASTNKMSIHRINWLVVGR